VSLSSRARPRSPLLRRRSTAQLSALLLLAGLLSLAPAGSALATHPEPPGRVTLMGSLMSELGCGQDWDEACTATDMAQYAGTGTWAVTGRLPAGSYEYKVRLDGSWDEAYPGGTDNLPLVLRAATELRFSWDETTHRVSVVPAAAPEPVGPADAALARDSLRVDLTRENFYFVMADRFEDGDPSNNTAGIPGTRLEHG
jgi:hypothetical protein